MGSTFPVLILGAGAAWVGLMVAMQDRRVTRLPLIRVSIKFDAARFHAAMRNAGVRLSEFEGKLRRLNATAIEASGSCRHLGDLLRREP